MTLMRVERKKIGRPTKKQERRDLIFEAYNKDYQTFGSQVIQQSIVEMEEQYQISWKQNMKHLAFGGGLIKLKNFWGVKLKNQ